MDMVIAPQEPSQDPPGFNLHDSPLSAAYTVLVWFPSSHPDPSHSGSDP